MHKALPPHEVPRDPFSGSLIDRVHLPPASREEQPSQGLTSTLHSPLLVCRGSSWPLSSFAARGSREFGIASCLSASQLLAGTPLRNTSPPEGTGDKSGVSGTLARSQQSLLGSVRKLHFEQCFPEPLIFFMLLKGE